MSHESLVTAPSTAAPLFTHPGDPTPGEGHVSEYLVRSGATKNYNARGLKGTVVIRTVLRRFGVMSNAAYFKTAVTCTSAEGPGGVTATNITQGGMPQNRKYLDKDRAQRSCRPRRCQKRHKDR